MRTLEQLNFLIENAAAIAGSQNKLARMMEMNPSNLVEMKQGKRRANWRVIGKLRAICGEEPARVFMEEIALELEQSESADEKKAAEGLRTILAAFAEKEKAPQEGLYLAGGNGGIRTLDGALHPILP